MAKSGYRFTVVAQKLNAEFNSTAITERMARERYGVLLRRLRAGNLGTVPEDETVGESSGASIGEQVGTGEANAAGDDAGAEPGDFQESTLLSFFRSSQNLGRSRCLSVG